MRLLILTLLLLSGCSSVAVQEGRIVYPYYSYSAFLEREPAETGELKDLTATQREEAMHVVNRSVNWLMDYESDIEWAKKRDYLTSKHEQVLRLEKVVGDCDDYTLTKLRILQLRGIVSNDNLWFAIVSVREPEEGLHAVAFVRIEDTYFVLDNNYKRYYNIDRLPYDIVKTTRMDEEGTFRTFKIN